MYTYYSEVVIDGYISFTHVCIIGKLLSVKWREYFVDHLWCIRNQYSVLKGVLTPVFVSLEISLAPLCISLFNVPICYLN